MIVVGILINNMKLSSVSSLILKFNFFLLFRGLNKYYGDADISAKLAEDVLNVLMVGSILSILYTDSSVEKS